MKMQHADSTNRPIEVPDDRVDLMKANGWVEHVPRDAKKSDD